MGKSVTKLGPVDLELGLVDLRDVPPSRGIYWPRVVLSLV